MVLAVAKRQNVPTMSRDEKLAAEVDHTIEQLQKAEREARKATATLEELHRVAQAPRL